MIERKNQCVQIGRFLKVHNNFFTKVAQIFMTFWALLKNSTFKVKVYFDWLLGNYWKIWQFFIPTSGHTGKNKTKEKNKKYRQRALSSLSTPTTINIRFCLRPTRFDSRVANIDIDTRKAGRAYLNDPYSWTFIHRRLPMIGRSLVTS